MCQTICDLCAALTQLDVPKALKVLVLYLSFHIPEIARSIVLSTSNAIIIIVAIVIVAIIIIYGAEGVGEAAHLPCL